MAWIIKYDLFQYETGAYRGPVGDTYVRTTADYAEMQAFIDAHEEDNKIGGYAVERMVWDERF